MADAKAIRSLAPASQAACKTQRECRDERRRRGDWLGGRAGQASEGIGSVRAGVMGLAPPAHGPGERENQPDNKEDRGEAKFRDVHAIGRVEPSIQRGSEKS